MKEKSQEIKTPATASRKRLKFTKAYKKQA
jgi:hypothetical protein